MRGLVLSCTIMAAGASSVCTDAHRWGKKLSSFASGSSPEGEAHTYVWGLLLFVAAFNFVCFDLTRDAAAADDNELRAAVADALLPDTDDETVPGTTLASLEAIYQEDDVLPATASKMTRLAERVEWDERLQRRLHGLVHFPEALVLHLARARCRNVWTVDAGQQKSP